MSSQKMLGQLLVEFGFVTEVRLNEALKIQEERDPRPVIGEVLLEIGYVSEVAILTALGIQSGIRTIDLDKITVSYEALTYVTPSVANEFRVFPVSFEDETLTIAVEEPYLAENVIENLACAFDYKLKVKAVLASKSQLDGLIQRYYPYNPEDHKEAEGFFPKACELGFQVNVPCLHERILRTL